MNSVVSNNELAITKKKSVLDHVEGFFDRVGVFSESDLALMSDIAKQEKTLTVKEVLNIRKIVADLVSARLQNRNALSDQDIDMFLSSAQKLENSFHVINRTSRTHFMAHPASLNPALSYEEAAAEVFEDPKTLALFSLMDLYGKTANELRDIATSQRPTLRGSALGGFKHLVPGWI